MKKLLIAILIVILYLIFRDKKKSKKKAYDILGEPLHRNRTPGNHREIIDVDFTETKRDHHDE